MFIFYDPVQCVITTRHIDTVGIQDLTAQGIFTALKDMIESYGIPLCNLKSFTSDTCNVMKGARNGVIAKLSTVQPKIVDIDQLHLPFK